MSIDRGGTATHDRTPAENLRALVRSLDPETLTNEVVAIAFRRIPGVGLGDEHLVKRIRDAFEREHALTRAKHWYRDHDKPPAITIPTDRTIDRDTGNTVTRADVLAAVKHYLGERERGCENPGGVIDCTGPSPAGYRCPACVQQGLREEAILDALLDAMDEEGGHQIGTDLERAVTDGGAR